MLALLTAAVAAASPPAPTVTFADAERCRPAAVHAATPPPVRSRKLGELPPGVLQLAVDKRVGGCSVTVLPTRDAQGNHRMILRGADVGLSPATSGNQRRSKRGR